jgi:hypothetical protein
MKRAHRLASLTFGIESSGLLQGFRSDVDDGMEGSVDDVDLIDAARIGLDKVDGAEGVAALAQEEAGEVGVVEVGRDVMLAFSRKPAGSSDGDEREQHELLESHARTARGRETTSRHIC